MRKLIYISLIALAGCTTSLSPEPQPPVPTGTSISSYFWPDSTATYTYTSTAGGDNHTVSISSGGGMLDNDISSNANTSLQITWGNGSDMVSGFSHSDLFGFDPSIQVVTDTSLAPASWTEPIRTIATAALGGGFNPTAKLYAASDSVLYAVNPNLTLDRIGSFPKSFTLAESPQGNALFAYQMGGDSIMWTTDDDALLWSGVKATSSITAFASATTNFFLDIGWFACGSNVYRITYGAPPQMIATLPSNVVTMTGENNGVVVGLDNGSMYDVTRNGQPQQRQAMAPGLAGVALISSGNINTNPVLAGTSSGVFAIPNFGPATQIDNGAVSVIFSTGSSIFAGVGPDSVFHYNANGTRYGAYVNPQAGIISQFARPTSAVPNSSQGIFALSGTNIFRRDSLTTGTWTAINQTISSTPALKPGSLTLLDSNSTWVAGYVERNMGAGLQRGYAYDAISSGPFTSYKAANGATYDSVLVVTYTSKANGVTDIANIPQYNIYYEKGVGPVVIERTENGNTVTTTYKKP